MKKLISGLLVLGLSFSLHAQTEAAKKTVTHKVHKIHATPSVYICNSSSAYAYHSSTGCYGLGRCRHTVSKVTLIEAKEMGYRACKICY